MTRKTGQALAERSAGPRSLRRWLTVGILVSLAAITLSALGTYAEGRVLNSVKVKSRTILRPAQTTAASLLAAYTDQETGQRGYLLTGQALFLAPYESGRAAAVKDQAQLSGLKINDAATQQALAAVTASGLAWQTLIAQPQIELRRNGPIPTAQLDALVLAGKQRFDRVRASLSALSGRIAELIAAEQTRYDHAQSLAFVATISALAIAVFTSALSIFALYALLSRPLTRLVGQVQRVAAGDFDRSIDDAGPAEIAQIAAAVETMRDNIVQHSVDLLAARRELALSEERDRIAADLHDVTIQETFALGLRLQAYGAREPGTGEQMTDFVNDTDNIIRGLRNVVFRLSKPDAAKPTSMQVLEVVNESSRTLGFTPELQTQTGLDLVVTPQASDELLAVVRESLSNIARHAQASRVRIEIAIIDGHLQLDVTDNGIGVSDHNTPGTGTMNIRTRAERLDGNARIAPASDGVGTTVTWRVPIN